MNANSRPSFIVQTLSFMNCSCNFICGLSDVIIKTFSQSVSQSQADFLLKRQNVELHKQHRTIVPELSFPDAKDLCEIRPESPSTEAPNAGGVGQNRRLSTNKRLYLEKGKR